MSKRKKRRRHSSERPLVAHAESRPADSRPAETRLVEAATVAWMLSTLVTLGAELVLAALALWRWLRPDNPLPAALAELFGLCAVAVGAVSLVLAALVLRLRSVPPPRGVTIVALAAAALPLVLVVYRLVR